ncbi:50S ribosomal protein L17 [Patescibacteria group bacterium]|jgi:large subunit ribosomal protein L17|nr:50S ribosomal protein L17 [Patescibacteria group bacterium]
MKHHVKQRTLGRPAHQRTALLRGLARSLILKESIETTLAKAKELRPYVEKLITRGTEDTVANRRFAARTLGARSEASQKLFTDLGPRFKERSGGYTRIVRTRVRQGDAAVMARIMLVK